VETQTIETQTDPCPSSISHEEIGRVLAKELRRHLPRLAGSKRGGVRRRTPRGRSWSGRKRARGCGCGSECASSDAEDDSGSSGEEEEEEEESEGALGDGTSSGPSGETTPGGDGSSRDEDEDEDDEDEDDEDEDEDEDEDAAMEDIMEMYNDEEMDYYQSLGEEDQQRVTSREIAVRDFDRKAVPLRFRILDMSIDMRLKALIIQKINTLAGLEYGSGEYSKLMGYINALSRIPLGVDRQLPLRAGESSNEEIGAFLTNAQRALDEAIYGQQDIKKQFLLTIAKWIANPEAKGLVIGIVGSPGCGKTLLIKEGLCKALGLPFAFIPIGGANDASFLDGHSFTYEGSMWGRISDALMAAGCMNPVLCFDELDKVADNHRGNEIFNVLTHMTDVTQNDSFCDKYFFELPLDVSRSVMVFTFNDESKIPLILKDRMTIMRAKSYSTADKLAIIDSFIIPRALAAHGMSPGDIRFDPATLRGMVLESESEGMRDLKRQVECVISNINMLRLLPPDMQHDFLADAKLLPVAGAAGAAGATGATGANGGAFALPVVVGQAHVAAFLKGMKRDGGDALLTHHLYM
jgi:hypothetical protein